jgi:hypothetical protein
LPVARRVAKKGIIWEKSSSSKTIII